MRGFWQVAAVVGTVVPVCRAEEPAKSFNWVPPKGAPSGFSQDLGLLDAEREEYATNLANHAANTVNAAKASPASLEEARRALGLALQLSPRNRRALVVGFQLSRGVVPDAVAGDYSPQVFARLILTRGRLLQKQGGTENLQVARYFAQLAAEIDPRNEEAVYASEVQRLDQGKPDWTPLTDAEAPKSPPGL